MNASTKTKWPKASPHGSMACRRCRPFCRPTLKGRRSREQNISEWRKGGYEEWVERENALEVTVRLGQRAQELEADDHRLSLSEALACWLMVRLAVATRELEKMEWEKQWPMVTKMCANLAKLRRIEKEAKKERQALEAARQQKRKAMVIAEEEMEEWCEALEEEKVEEARREVQAAARPPSIPHESQPPPRTAAKVAEPGKATQAAQVEKMGKAIQDMRAAQVARAMQSAKAAQMARVVRAAVGEGRAAAPAIYREPSVAAALAADATEMDGMFRVEQRLEKGSGNALRTPASRVGAGKALFSLAASGPFNRRRETGKGKDEL